MSGAHPRNTDYRPQTQKIVGMLARLMPGRPLNSWFTTIVAHGTGRTFQTRDNANWTEVTRPILAAFFHARFFLEMAVRYSELESPQSPLPSGYAPLLYLFDLRYLRVKSLFLSR